MREPLVRGDRVILLDRPTGHLTGLLPLTPGEMYLFAGWDGSNVRTTCDDPAFGIVSYSGDRVRAVSDYKPVGKGGWEARCDGVRFTFFRPTPGCPYRGAEQAGGWWCRAFADADEWQTWAATRDAGVAELYQMVRAARAEAVRYYDRGAVGV